MQQMFGTLEERGSLGLIEFSSIDLQYWKISDETAAVSLNTWYKLPHEKKNGENIVLLTFCVIFYGFGRLAR